MQGSDERASWARRVMAPLRGLFSAKTPEAPAYTYQPVVAQMSYDEGVALLESRGHRVVRASVDISSPHVVEAVRRGLVENGVAVEDFQVDPAEFARYQAAARYAERYPGYYGIGMPEKQLEHFLTLQWLALGPQDVFIDIASEDSPVPDIFERLTGATTYWQDIQYPAGVAGRRIGGDACAMPVPDGFATAAALTCSIEHFEQSADMLLCDELGRVLRPGGRLVVAPLYMYSEAVTQTDPVYSAQADVPFDPGNALYAAKDWRNRHGRFYSPRTLSERVVSRLAASFDCTVRCFANPDDIPGYPYLRFALYCRRR